MIYDCSQSIIQSSNLGDSSFCKICSGAVGCVVSQVGCAVSQGGFLLVQELWDVLYHKVARLLLNFDVRLFVVLSLLLSLCQFFKTPFVFQVKLVIIDSVAALFRAVHPTGDDGLQIPGTTP
eukprot:GHVQ01009283.1.p1 GENE.GHVQ01009283.1~~GHVQ01009283.1.p1  ORF type:complete len:122 (-),score=8.30 GHVQ01009283.1:3794-4159(-)